MVLSTNTKLGNQVGDEMTEVSGELYSCGNFPELHIAQATILREAGKAFARHCEKMVLEVLEEGIDFHSYKVEDSTDWFQRVMR